MLWQEILNVTRNSVTERTLHGSVAVVAKDKILICGQVDASCYSRSLLKPFQIKVVADVLDTELDTKEKAISLSSHMGDTEHMQVLQGLLKRCENKEHLQTPSEPAMGNPKGKPSPLAHPCSGKHLALLVACKKKNWPAKDYLLENHPYNQLLRSDIEKRLKRELKNCTPDGCGLPTWTMKVSDMARLYQQLAAEKDHDWIWQNMRQHPELVGGQGRLDTKLMQSIPNIIAKEGADGLLGVAFSSAKLGPVGVTIKTAHGFDPNLCAQVIYPILKALRASDIKPETFARQEVELSPAFKELLEVASHL